MIKVYLAGPFFNPKQVAVIDKLERALRFYPGTFELFSPRSAGPIENLSPEEKAARAEAIFADNVDKMLWADMILAVIDGRDTGTTWEQGFCYALRMFGPRAPLPRIVTYTEENFGLNIMLRYSVDGHLHGIDEAVGFLAAVERGVDLDDELRCHQNFNPAVI